MRYLEFIEKTIENDIPQNLFCINDPVPDDVYCICRSDQQWDVFYRESGEALDREIFLYEEAAWDNLFKRLIRIVEIRRRSSRFGSPARPLAQPLGIGWRLGE